MPVRWRRLFMRLRPPAATPTTRAGASTASTPGGSCPEAGIPGELPGKGSMTLRVRPEGPRGGHENDHLVTAAALRVFATRSCAYRLCLGLGMVALGGPAWCRRGLAKSY